MAVANYKDANGHFPPAFVRGPDGTPWHSWRVLILPYIEGEELYGAYRFDEPWDGPHNISLLPRMPSSYRLHSLGDKTTTATNYLAVVGEETLWPGDVPFCGDAPPDGYSNTILLVENLGRDVPWLAPDDLRFADMNLTFDHPLGMSSGYKSPGAAMADGSVRKFGPRLTPAALRAMLTANGGETVNEHDGGWEVIPDGRLREVK